MQFNFQIHDQKGTRIYKQPYSGQNTFHVDMDLDKGYYLYVLKYKKYAFVSTKLPFQGETRPHVKKPPAVEYAYKIKRGLLHFQITSAGKAGATYAFHILCNGKAVHKQPYGASPSVVFELTAPGRYSVTYFVQDETGIYTFFSEVKSYFPQAAHVYGPEALKDCCLDADIIPMESAGDGVFTLADPIGLAWEWAQKVFLTDTPEPQAAAAMRDGFSQLLSAWKGHPVYVVQWNLWESRTVSRHLIWVLEEFYHICRKPEWNTVELLPAIAAAQVRVEEGGGLSAALYRSCGEPLNAALKEAVKRHELSALDDARIEVVQEGDRLTARFVYSDRRDTDHFSFYLLRNGQLYHKIPRGTSPEAEWTLSEDGVYVVHGMIMRGENMLIRRALGPAWFGASTREEFARFLTEDAVDCSLADALPFVPESEPLYNILVVSEKGCAPSLLSPSFPIPCLTQAKTGAWSTAVYSQGKLLTCANGEQAVLSGRLHHGHKIYFGAEAETCLECGETLSGQCGQYSYAAWGGGHFTIGADYFGFERWFYYQSEGLFIASNRYCPLLLALKERNLTPSLDVDKACITLSSAGINFLSQNFCRSMDMEGVYQLTVDQRFVLGEQGWTLTDSETGRLLKEEPIYHEEVYREQLAEAKTELIENLSDILDEPRFKKLVVELNGDLDSRMVYSALTHLTFDRDRVKINTHPAAGTRNLELATRINGMYHYKYNDFPQTIEVLSLREGDIRCRNICLGIYYGYGLINKKLTDPERGNITGACGEIISRPVYSRKYLNTPVAKQTDFFAFARSIYDDYAHIFCIGAEAFGAAFCKYVGLELSSLPGGTPIQAFENHYFTYRHGYRFGDSDRATGALQLKPLQSPKTMRLFKMAYMTHQSIRTQLDILYQLNPAVASIPLNSDMDNAVLEHLRPELAVNEPCWRDMRLLPEADQAPWDEAEARRKAGAHCLNISHSGTDELPVQQLLYLGLLKHFRILMRACPELCDRVGVPLYAHFQRIKDNMRELSSWYSKVTSLMDQMAVFYPILSSSHPEQSAHQ